PLEVVQVEVLRPREHCAEVSRESEYQPGTNRHQPERDGLAPEVGPSLTVPGLAGQEVAHDSADDRGQDARDAASPVQWSDEQEQCDLAGRERDSRYEHEPDHLRAGPSAEPVSDDSR